MADVIWPAHALDQIAEIIAYIRQDNPVAAEKVGEQLFALGESLAAFPNRGRPAAHGTREMTNVWPYVLRYHVENDVVTILWIRHGARRRLD